MVTIRLLGRAAGIAAVLLTLAIVAGPLGSRFGHGNAFAAQAVDTGEYYFAPADLTINVGDTVVWMNSGAEDHTVNADDNSWGTDNLARGQSYSHTFTAPGVYTYSCVIHDGQTGTITVK